MERHRPVPARRGAPRPTSQVRAHRRGADGQSPAPGRRRRTICEPATRVASSGPARTAPTVAAAHRAAGSPPTWSRWKCVSTSSGDPVTPRSRRQRSIGTGSGPASISTAAPGPAFEQQRVALPDVAGDEHPARRRPRRGHRPHRDQHDGGGDRGAGEHPPRPGVQRDAAHERQQRPRAAAARRPSRPATGTVAPCSPPKQSATPTSHRHGHPASHASAPRRRQPHRRDHRRARSPSTVAGATTGSASTLAGIATRLTRPEIAGDHRRRDEVRRRRDRDRLGHARRDMPAAQRPRPARRDQQQRRRRQHRHGERRRSRPAVGSQTSRRSVAADERRHRRARPPGRERGQRDARPSAPPAARSATAARPPRTPPARAPPSAAQTHGRARMRRSTSRTAPTTIEQFVPLTATRWVSPASRNCSASTGSSAAVSPSTSPGSSPRSWSGSPAHGPAQADAHRAGRAAATTAAGRAGPAGAGEQRDRQRRRGSSGGCSVPSTSTRCPGSTPCHGPASAEHEHVAVGSAPRPSAVPTDDAPPWTCGPRRPAPRAVRGEQDGGRRRPVSTSGHRSVPGGELRPGARPARAPTGRRAAAGREPRTPPRGRCRAPRAARGAGHDARPARARPTAATAQTRPSARDTTCAAPRQQDGGDPRRGCAAWPAGGRRARAPPARHPGRSPVGAVTPSPAAAGPRTSRRRSR